MHFQQIGGSEESGISEREMAQRICYLLGLSLSEWQEMRQMVKQNTRKCATMETVLRRSCCSAQMLYSQITLDNLSDKTRVELNKVETGLGGDFVDLFPVPPGKAIKLCHAPRPGYTPTKIMIDFSLAGGGDNYLDLSVQFFLTPNESDVGHDLGSTYSGNDFLNKDGGQIHLPFPTYRGRIVDVGSLERMCVVIRHTGAVNALQSAKVRLLYDARDFYDKCKAECEGGCETSVSRPVG